MDGRVEENGDLDFVQWQSSQTACAALDTLLSEASFTSPSDGFQRKKGASYTRDKLSKSSPYASGSSASWMSSNGLSPSSDSTPPSTSNFTVNPKNVTNDHRTRLSRSSSSSTIDLSPVHDPDQFINMLKGISQRIDGNIRNDVGPSRERLKRKQQSKRVSNSSDLSIKRVKNHPSSSKSVRSSSEGSKKGKLSSGIPVYPSGPSGSSAYTDSAGVTRNNNVTLGKNNPPKSSYEAMPPPPVPLAKHSPLSSSSTSLSGTRPACNPLQTGSSSKVLHRGGKSAEQCNKNESPPIPPQKLHTTNVPDNAPSSSSSTSTSTQNVSLHPLLDPERKQRRLKLERTISASLASLPDKPSPSSSSSSQTTPTVVTQQKKLVSVLRQVPEKQQPVSLPPSQGRLNGASRPPPLGMRRTHTYPQLSQQMSQCVSLPNKTFKPPLLSNSQPTQTATQRAVQSQESPAPKNSARQSHSQENQDEEMEDVHNSDADLSFGDAVSFDVDMDVLEETMRMYD